MRVLAALACIALLLWCSAAAPTAAHLDTAIPVLVFLFLVVVRLALLHASDDGPEVQPVALFRIDISRAPPLA